MSRGSFLRCPEFRRCQRMMWVSVSVPGNLLHPEQLYVCRGQGSWVSLPEERAKRPELTWAGKVRLGLVSTSSQVTHFR